MQGVLKKVKVAIDCCFSQGTTSFQLRMLIPFQLKIRNSVLKSLVQKLTKPYDILPLSIINYSVVTDTDLYYTYYVHNMI